MKNNKECQYDQSIPNWFGADVNYIGKSFAKKW